MKYRTADILILLPGLLIGGYLRLHNLLSQIPLGDEWHALNYVIELPYGWLMTHLGGCATSPPMNLYTRFLLDHFGWSEFWLRLPTIAAGLLGLVLLPLLVLRICGRKIAFVFSLLIAISPLLVLYDRNARPYACVVLFGAISVLSFWEWSRGGRLHWAILAAISGALAIWLHLFAAIAVLVPILWGMVWSFYSHYRHKPESATGPDELRRTNPEPLAQEKTRIRRGFAPAFKFGVLAMGTSILAAILILPAVVNSLGIKMRVHAGKDKISLQSLSDAAEMVSGNGHSALMLIFWGLVIHGAICLCRSRPIIGGGVLLTMGAYVLAFAVIRPDDISTAIVLCRYAIILFPVIMILPACSLGQITETATFLSPKGKSAFFAATAMLLCGGLFVTGPLPRFYKAPNDFINPDVFFLESNRFKPDFSQLATLATRTGPDGVPEFYHALARSPEIQTVIEYPLVIGDQLNWLHFYQQIHRKTVKIGYYSQLAEPSPPQGLVANIHGEIRFTRECCRGDDTPDDIFSRVPDKKKLGFRNMVDLSDLDNVPASGADILVLHKGMLGAWSPHAAAVATHPIVKLIADKSRERWGPPMFEDGQIVVFDLK